MTDGMDLTGYEVTAAAELVRFVDERLTGWERSERGPGLWVWRTEVDDWRPVVAVNALPDRILVPTHLWAKQVGPTLLAGTEGGAFASATLSHMSDLSEMRQALRVAAVLVSELDPAVVGRG